MNEAVVYAEAGQWVRLTNTVAWAMAAFLFSMLLAPVVLALTTSIPRPLLVGASIFIAVFWLYFEYLYDRGARQARQMLIDLEAGTTFTWPKLYTLQATIVPKGWWSTHWLLPDFSKRPTLFELLCVFCDILLVVWIVIFTCVKPYVPLIAGVKCT
jgi:hypothetical protein